MREWAELLERLFLRPLLRRYLLPSTCYFCGRPLTGRRYLVGPPASICAPCRALLPFVESERQGMLLSAHHSGAGGRCLYPRTYNLKSSNFLELELFPCYSALCYEEPVKRAVAALKFHGDLTAVSALGALLAHCLEQFVLPIEGRPDYLVPVPLHPQRERERGFNQAAELAAEAGHLDHLPVLPKALLRVRQTARQSELKGADERAVNVAGAFQVSPQQQVELTGKFLLLLDDVLTTGATVINAARALMAAGATKVVILTLAAD